MIKLYVKFNVNFSNTKQKPHDNNLGIHQNQAKA